MRKLLMPNMSEMFDQELFMKGRDDRETLMEAFERKYPKYAENFKVRFESATMAPFEWESITPLNCEKFKRYLIASGLSPNSVNQYCKKFKSVISPYKERLHNLDPDCRVVLNAPRDENHEAYVDDNDIKLLFDYLNKLEADTEHKIKYNIDRNEREKIILKQFIVGLFTGARHSDYIHFNWENLSQGYTSDGEEIYVLTYVSVKTGIKASIPLSLDSPVVQIIRDMPTVEYPTAAFNCVLKDIMKKAGLTRIVKRHHAGVDEEIPLYQCAASHMARRSFCTNYIAAGANLTDVMYMMGHTNPEQTYKYNCGTPIFDSKIVSKRSGS